MQDEVELLDVGRHLGDARHVRLDLPDLLVVTPRRLVHALGNLKSETCSLSRYDQE